MKNNFNRISVPKYVMYDYFYALKEIDTQMNKH